MHTFWCDLTLRWKETEEKLAVSNFSNLAIKRFTADKIPSQSYNNFLDSKIFESIFKYIHTNQVLQNIRYQVKSGYITRIINGSKRVL